MMTDHLFPSCFNVNDEDHYLFQRSPRASFSFDRTFNSLPPLLYGCVSGDEEESSSAAEESVVSPAGFYPYYHHNTVDTLSKGVQIVDLEDDSCCLQMMQDISPLHRGGDDVKPHQSRLIRDQQLTSTSNGAAAAVEETGMYLLKNSGSDYHHQDTKDCWGASSTMMQLNSPFLGTAMGRPSSNNEPALVPGLRPPILPPSHHLTSQTPSVKIEYDTEKMITVPAVQEQQQRTTSPTTPPLLPENLVNTGASTASAADMTIVPLQRDLPSFLRHKLKSTQKLLDKKKKTVPFWKQNTKSANNCCISQIATHKNGRKRRLADMSPRSLELFKADVWNYHHIWQKHLSQIPDEREVAASKHFMSIRQTI
eukprot:TRINITY_DN15354_c0_g1_i1.p1 TRINITY_DN15354_c0_g1~~TRINITY_DN15354_c0_g1_i1.p1  ORF type:complete len:367 (-),score=43.28 TRINITY_DN15354_c0_g1_i1:195-1295(-)